MRKRNLLFLLILLLGIALADESCKSRHKASRLRSKKGCNCDF